MRQLAPVGIGFLVAASALLWSADDQPRKAQVEPMSQDRFSEDPLVDEVTRGGVAAGREDDIGAGAQAELHRRADLRKNGARQSAARGAHRR